MPKALRLPTLWFIFWRPDARMSFVMRSEIFRSSKKAHHEASWVRRSFELTRENVVVRKYRPAVAGKRVTNV